MVMLRFFVGDILGDMENFVGDKFRETNDVLGHNIGKIKYK